MYSKINYNKSIKDKENKIIKYYNKQTQQDKDQLKNHLKDQIQFNIKNNFKKYNKKKTTKQNNIQQTQSHIPVQQNININKYTKLTKKNITENIKQTQYVNMD